MTTYIEKLKSQGLKFTPRRREMLNYFIKEGRCLTPEDVWNQLKKHFKHIGFPSVYRNLESFEECGILVKIQREERRLYYALCHSHSNDHHHHIVCVKCGKVEDVDGCALASMGKASGFKVLKHFVQLEGLCPNCV